MEINIYWNDLSDEGKDTLLSQGLEMSKEEIDEVKPVGTLNVKL